MLKHEGLEKGIQNKRSFKINKLDIIIILFCIVYFLSVSIFSVLNERVNEPDTKVIATNTAEKYFYKADYDKSIWEYKKIYEKDKSSIWLVKIAEVYSVKGDIKASRDYIVKAEGVKDNNAEIENYIVFTEFMNKDYQKALEDGEKALKRFPKDKNLIKTMFSVYMSNNKIDSASKLLSSYPVNAKSSYDKAEYARMLILLDKWDEGIANLYGAWNINKDEAKVYDVISQVSAYQKDDLLKVLLDKLQKDSNNVAYKLWIAKVYSLDTNTVNEAAKMMTSIEKQDIGKIEPVLIRISILQNAQNNDAAQNLINKIIEKYPDDYRVLHEASWYFLKQKDFKKAEAYCEKSILKNKNYMDNYGFLMPEILKDNGKSLEGEPFFRTAIFKEPYNYNIMINTANYYWYTAKNINKALEYYKMAEIITPNDAEIKYNIALLELADNKPEEAVNVLNKCISIQDSVPKYHRTLGTIYMTMKNGNTDEAIKQIRYAYQNDENDILTLNNAGCYYISIQEDVERGMFNLQKAYSGINDSTDEYTKATIKANYEKAKSIYDQYKKGSGDIKIPDFQLFY
ncbi:MAG: hypothetical protein Q8936_04600 [Bacillota bacterium]|nr:hypothetical protein [Bacillota bacterium]